MLNVAAQVADVDGRGGFELPPRRALVKACSETMLKMFAVRHAGGIRPNTRAVGC